MENHRITQTTAWLLLGLFAVAKESIAAGGWLINHQLNKGILMTITKRKKAGHTNKAAMSKTTNQSISLTKPVTSQRETSREERRQVIAVAAYHKAERRGFAPGDDLRDWIEAEREIDRLLLE